MCSSERGSEGIGGSSASEYDLKSVDVDVCAPGHIRDWEHECKRMMMENLRAVLVSFCTRHMSHWNHNLPLQVEQRGTNH